MKAEDREFTRIINGATQFVIPVFQRDYSWTEEQCSQFWDDVIRVGRNPAGRHFIGSVVYVASGEATAGFTQWLLIDGQQRMTTLLLLLLALAKHIRDTGWEPPDENGPTADRIEDYFLLNTREKGARRYKLILRRGDDQALRALLDREQPTADAPSRISENLEFFSEKMKGVDPADVYAGVGRLVVVDIALDQGRDDAQMIFESLNSTGLDLGQADLIRNYILMRLPEPEQTQLYDKYWVKIDDLFRRAPQQFDAFARDYMAVETRATKQTRGDQIYREFREFYAKRKKEWSDNNAALEHMLRFARFHAAFTLGRGAPPPIARELSRLKQLAEVAATVVMRLSWCHQQDTLPDDEFVEALRLLESYVLRRAVCGMQTRGYWEAFATLANRVRDDRPLESLKVALSRQRESYRFPSDEEFRRELLSRDVYAMRPCHYMLDRFENHGSKEPTETKSYTVEHVLPQNENLSKAWRDMLGEDWQRIQQEWLHRLGNLTLTGYNSTYSDRAFEEKKTIGGGFNDSSVRLNKFIREQLVWTQAEIQRRGEMLADRALEIWPPLIVSQEALRAARAEELRMRAQRRPPSDVEMTQKARKLFVDLEARIKTLGDDVIEVAETRSVSFHAADFFLEILPRRHGVVLQLNLDFAECDDAGGRASDATEYKFLPRAAYTGGVIYPVDHADQIEGAMPLVRQAYQLARA